MASVLSLSSARPGGRDVRAIQRRWVRWGVLGWLAASTACKTAGAEAVSMPPAEAYDMPSDFAGRWRGEVDGEVGTLRIDPLGEGRYRGLYEGTDIRIEYVLLLEQDFVPVGQDQLLGNRAVFTWQDGHGGRGEGWLLINRSDSAITGAFGERGELDRQWTFMRDE